MRTIVSIFCTIALSAGMASAQALPPATRLLQLPSVASAGPWRFYSAFWPNLHHVLYASAWAKRLEADPKARVRSGLFPKPWPSVA